MEKKESRKAQDIKNQPFEKKNLTVTKNSNKKIDKPLPWWVELLFVQIGLPDKWLIKILKTKKKSSEIIQTEKKYIILFLFVLSTLIYIYPIIKYSKSRLDCEVTAKNYLLENMKFKKNYRKQIKMLSTNFCNGGNEVYKIENIK